MRSLEAVSAGTKDDNKAFNVCMWKGREVCSICLGDFPCRLSRYAGGFQSMHMEGQGSLLSLFWGLSMYACGRSGKFALCLGGFPCRL